MDIHEYQATELLSRFGVPAGGLAYGTRIVGPEQSVRLPRACVTQPLSLAKNDTIPDHSRPGASEGMQVLILGYGEMGHAMETLLGPRHELAIWDKYPPEGFRSVNLDEAVPAADCVVFCLPANPHAEVLERITPRLRAGSLCISIAKGLDESGRSANGIFEATLGGRHDYALLYGPMISEDIRAGRDGFAEAGCGSEAMFERIRALFNGSTLHLAHSTDLPGITWSVILKNVYAIAFGIIDALAWGDNTRGFLMVQALAELDRIVVDLGGRGGTPYQLAGLGDLVTTATSKSSHHHTLGGKLARGEIDAPSGEGVHTLAMIKAHSILDIEQYPLMATVDRIVTERTAAAERLQRYIDTCFD